MAFNNPLNEALGKKGVKKEAKYLHDQEKKALAALDHPNIIKPVNPNGYACDAEKMTVFEVRNFSAEEKQALEQETV